MANFNSNWDDKELYLPSHILPNNEVSPKVYPDFPSELTYMEELAQQILLEQKQINPKSSSTFPPNMKQFRSRNLFPAIVPPRPSLGLGFARGTGTGTGHILYPSGNGGTYFGSRPVYQTHTIKPAEPQVRNFVQSRPMILQRQQNQIENRFLPFQGNGSFMGGFKRESGGGTGVFLPRIAATTEFRKKHNGRNGEQEYMKKKGPVKKVSVGKEDQPPAEMGLPQEWTY